MQGRSESDTLPGSGLEATIDAGASASARAEDRPGLKRGDVVGRYVALELIGAGGMGVVYAAYDPDLDRKVALKLLGLESKRRGNTQNAVDGLVAEAQAMARLNHPNVITVHDVGARGNEVFIAMEYLEGGTLTQWRRSEERSIDEIVALFVQAGRGLGAAHEAGVVHGDFKPDNVLLGADARVRVSDFGLAREHEPSASSSALARRELAQTGGFVGTPAYMAPEQHLGKPADARSDQFSFCVALFEALSGSRPWSAGSLAALHVAVTEAAPAELPSTVPAHVRRAVMRGLSRDPDARWSSMDSLIDALDRRRTRRMWWAVAPAILVAGLVGAWFVRTRDDVCSGGPSRLGKVWTSERSSEVAEAIRGTGLSYAEHVAQRVPAQIDRYAGEWVDAYTDACRATRVLGEQSEALLDLRMSCLEDRLVALEALAEVVAQAEVKTVQEAGTAVASLPAIDACADREALLAAVPPPGDPETARIVDQARTTLARADALLDAGHYEESVRVATQVVEHLGAVSYAPALAEALYVLGDGLEELGEYGKSISAFQRAYRLALASGHDSIATRSAAALVYAEGYLEHRPERALLWAEHAQALVERTGSPAELEAAVLAARGTVLVSQGKLQDGRALYEKALSLRVTALGADHHQVWALEGNLAVVNSMLGEYDTALKLHEEVLVALEKQLGPMHPHTAMRLVNYALALIQADRRAQARPLLERALAIREAALGPEHPDTNDVLSNLGVLYFQDGDMQQAKRYFERALEGARKHGDETGIATGLAHLANIAGSEGRSAEARPLYLEALEIQRRTMGEHPFVAVTLTNLAHNAVQLESWEEAADWAEQAIGAYERALGAGHPDLHGPLVFLAQAKRRLGDQQGAMLALERAVELTADTQASHRGTALFTLAEILWDRGEHRDRARTLATEALQFHDRTGDPNAATEVRAWLRERQPG